MMTVGSLFSGIGGFDLGLERAGMRIEWQVENNEFCREVLKKHWPKVPCHYDIRQIDWRDIPRVELICGGFPCQPFSLAGKRRGASDDRYLWPEVVRCLDALRPTWFLGENVPGIINLALDQVCADLESLGYTVWPVCVPACAVDAPHQRQRVWIIGHADKSSQSDVSVNAEVAELQGTHANPDRNGQQGGIKPNGIWEEARTEQTEISPCQWTKWDGLPSSRVCRVDARLPQQMDRLRGLGNAVVPQVVETFGRMILISQQEAP